MVGIPALQTNEPSTLLRTVEGRIVSWSRAMERRYGIPEDAAVGYNADRLLGTVFPTFAGDIKKAFQAHGTWRGGILTHHRDGTPLLTISQWHRDSSGGPAAHLVTEIHTDPIGALEDDDGQLAEDLISVISALLVETISAASAYAAAGTRLLGTLPDAMHARLVGASDGVRHEIQRNQIGIRLLKDLGRDLGAAWRRRERSNDQSSRAL